MVGIGLLGLAGSCLYRESAPYGVLGGDDVSKWGALRNVVPETGLSIVANQFVLDQCLAASTSLFGRTRASTDRASVLDHCMTAAKQSSNEMPASSYAWLIYGLTAGQLGRAAEFNDGIQRSWETGANEQWLAELRVGQTEENFSVAIEPTKAVERHDLAMLVVSQRGIASIAKRYVSDPGFRDRVVAIVETLPTPDQQRFVSAVKQAALSSGTVR